MANESEFRRGLESLINRHSKENGSDTPDFILAGYLESCLATYDATVVARDQWYGRPVGNGRAKGGDDESRASPSEWRPSPTNPAGYRA